MTRSLEQMERITCHASRKSHALDRHLSVPTIFMNLHFWFHGSWVYNPDNSALASANIVPDNTSGLQEPDVAAGPIDLWLSRDAHLRINRFVISSCSPIEHQVTPFEKSSSSVFNVCTVIIFGRGALAATILARPQLYIPSTNHLSRGICLHSEAP